MSPPSDSPAPTFELAPFEFAQVHELEAALGLEEPVAITLCRRGLDDPGAARAFLAADERHDPHEMGGIDDAVAAARGAIARAERITVHGDYDVDGVSATAILVGALRRAGADADWLIPDRLGGGYGLTETSVRELAERGSDLVITVDCGITSVAEVARASELGMAVVVTDHHTPGDELPDCPVVHPWVGEYPCLDLCGAGVAHKLVAALFGPEEAERDLDLVALATVADMVELVGENRSLVRRGLELARRAPRPGLRALMAIASVNAERLNEIDISFRLAPRINAAGRLYRADAGVELLLCEDEDRAKRIAEELNSANHERRETGAAVLAEAEAQVRELDPEAAEAPALVLWGRGWHPGVVGICASRIAERHGKPALLIALDDEGKGRGSGRSVPGFDLLACLSSCAELLVRYGGHTAAAGFEVTESNLGALRDSFGEHARAQLKGDLHVYSEHVDAVVGAGSLGLQTAEQFARLGPFGRGNPSPRVLVAGAEVRDVRGMGEEERHARFSLHGFGGRAAGVAFNVGSSLARAAESGRLDLLVGLELNEWNGAVEPRVVLQNAFPIKCEDESFMPPPAADQEFFTRLDAELERVAGRSPSAPEAFDRSTHRRERIDIRPGGTLAAVTELAASGEATILITADAARRVGVATLALDPARFGGELAVIAGRRSLLTAEEDAAQVLEAGRGALLCDWAALATLPGLAEPFEHAVVVDPPPSRHAERVALARGRGAGFTHDAWGDASVEFAARVYEADLPTRASLASLYRDLRDSGDIEAALRGIGGARDPESAARGLAVLLEIGAVSTQGSGRARRLRVVSSETGGLDSSELQATFNAEGKAVSGFLSELRQRKSSPAT